MRGGHTGDLDRCPLHRVHLLPADPVLEGLPHAGHLHLALLGHRELRQGGVVGGGARRGHPLGSAFQGQAHLRELQRGLLGARHRFNLWVGFRTIFSQLSSDWEWRHGRNPIPSDHQEL